MSAAMRKKQAPAASSGKGLESITQSRKHDIRRERFSHCIGSGCKSSQTHQLLSQAIRMLLSIMVLTGDSLLHSSVPCFLSSYGLQRGQDQSLSTPADG